MKKILITGASEGIGLETAKILARQGNQLTLVARGREKLEKALASLPGSGHTCFTADLSTKEGTHTVADHMTAQHYDVLINNAGVGLYGRFEELPLGNQVKMMELNMWSVTALSHFYLKSARSGDCLINLSSTLGVTTFPGLATYAATKAYLENFSDSLWWENKKRGVYVCSICPGATRTSFHEKGSGSADAFPPFILQTPQAVALDLVRAFKRRRKPRVVSGGINRSMLFFFRFLSRKAQVNMMGRFSPVR